MSVKSLKQRQTQTLQGQGLTGWGEPVRERLGLPVPLDLGHIGHAPNAEAEVLAIQGAGDGAGNAGLAHPRGAVEAEDLALGGASELADSNELLRAEVGSREIWSLAALCRARAVTGKPDHLLTPSRCLEAARRDKSCPGGAKLTGGIFCHKEGPPVAPMGQVGARRTW